MFLHLPWIFGIKYIRRYSLMGQRAGMEVFSNGTKGQDVDNDVRDHGGKCWFCELLSYGRSVGKIIRCCWLLRGTGWLKGVPLFGECSLTGQTLLDTSWATYDRPHVAANVAMLAVDEWPLPTWRSRCLTIQVGLIVFINMFPWMSYDLFIHQLLQLDLFKSPFTNRDIRSAWRTRQFVFVCDQAAQRQPRCRVSTNVAPQRGFRISCFTFVTETAPTSFSLDPLDNCYSNTVPAFHLLCWILPAACSIRTVLNRAVVQDKSILRPWCCRTTVNQIYQ